MINIEKQKQWWAPLWQGLVMDNEAKHYQKLGNAIWIFLYLILNADRSTGFLRRKIETMASDTGIKKRTISQWLGILREKEYIQTWTTGRCLCIQIKKWKSIREWQRDVIHSGKTMPLRVAKSCYSDELTNSRNFSYLSQKSTNVFTPIDNTLKKYIVKNVNVSEKLLDFNAYNGHTSENDKDALAFEICKAFKDEKNLALYLSYVKRYSEEVIIKAFNQVRAMPLDKIKKTKGALFTYLVKRYAQDKTTS